MEVKLKSLAKDWDHGARKFQRRRASARFEHAQNLRQPALDVFQVSQTESDGHDVEAAFGEWQSQRVPPGEEGAPDLFSLNLFIPDDKHRMAEVAADDARMFFQFERQVCRSATQIESERPWTRERVLQLFDGEAPPEPVEVDREQVV